MKSNGAKRDLSPFVSPASQAGLCQKGKNNGGSRKVGHDIFYCGLEPSSLCLAESIMQTTEPGIRSAILEMKHGIGTLYYVGENPDVLNFPNDLERAALKTAWDQGLRVRNSDTHVIWPQGLTCIVHLEGGHIALHSYPQRHCIFVDCYTGSCGHPHDYVKALSELIAYKFEDYRAIHHLKKVS